MINNMETVPFCTSDHLEFMGSRQWIIIRSNISYASLGAQGPAFEIVTVNVFVVYNLTERVTEPEPYTPYRYLSFTGIPEVRGAGYNNMFLFICMRFLPKGSRKLENTTILDCNISCFHRNFCKNTRFYMGF